MKKTILSALVLIICLSCAFCVSLTESHEIKLRTNVAATTPAFQMEFTSGKYFPDAIVVTNADADEYDPDVTHDEFGTKDTAVDVADISREDLDLLFTVKLANNAKCNSNYRLNFTASPFAVKRNGVAGVLNPDEGAVVAAATDLASRKGVAVAEVVEGESIKLHFNGTDCVAGNLATFRVQYTADPSIDDTGNGEYYYADICLLITAES